MNKAPWHVVAPQLDRLWFFPLSQNETPDLRNQTIHIWLDTCRWTWDDVIKQLTHDCMSE